MQLSTEVLPAPFGPIRASSSPCRARKEMPCSTFSPPKASDSDWTSSSAIPAPRTAVLLDVAIASAGAAAAEIELLDILVSAQPLGRPVQHDAPVFHHVA